MKNQSRLKRSSQTRVLTAHVPADLAVKVDQIAEFMERPRGWIVKQALLAWVEDEERHHQMTLEALAAADAGEVVDHEEVEKWIRSLNSDRPLPPPVA